MASPLGYLTGNNSNNESSNDTPLTAFNYFERQQEQEKTREQELLEALQRVASGEMSAEDFYALYNSNGSGWSLSPDQEKWLDNLLSNQRTEEARQWEDYMASNDILRTAGQLGTLGLSPNNVLTMGGSSANGVSAADVVKTNNAENRLNRQNLLARSLIGMASAMASAGIHGGSLGLVRSVAGNVASRTAHSASYLIRRI